MYIQTPFLWLLGIVNEIMYIRHIRHVIKYPVSGNYYYKKQQSKVVKSIGFGIRSLESRILTLPLTGRST